MKNLLTYEDFLTESLLNEIGDASAKVYKWTLDNSLPSLEQAHFDVDGMKYTVWLGHFRSGVNVTFDANGDDKVTTNQGKQYRIMSTVIEIIKDYIERNPSVFKISFVPNEDFGNDERRLKLYMAYIEKQFDVIDTKIEQLQNNKVIEITLNR